VDITAALIGADGKSKEGTEKIIGTLESIIRDLKSGAEDKN
jgi:hypothetical protein